MSTQYFNFKNYKVTSNDVVDYAYKLCYSRNCIARKDITFNLLGSNIVNVLKVLNNCRHKGFIYYNYAPNKELEYTRKYFTNENAEIIDGIRVQI